MWVIENGECKIVARPIDEALPAVCLEKKVANPKILPGPVYIALTALTA
jgi:hypothetical protein